MSEIVLTPDAVRVEPDVPEPRLQIAVELPGGFIMRHPSCPWGEFKIHLPVLADTAEHLSPSISGNNGYMSLYNWEYKCKQALYCGEIYQLSDRRNKEDIEDMPEVLPLVASAVGANPSERRSVRAVGGVTEAGIFEKIAPSSIVINDGDTMVNGAEVIPVLIKSAQELQEMVDEQDKTIETLHKAIEELRQKTNAQGRITGCSPNPADNLVNVTLDGLEASSDYSLKLLNLSGAVMASVTLTADQTTISMNTATVPAGVYHLVLSCRGSVADTFRLIIKH